MLICFDLDGVLVDACDWHKIALEKAMIEVLGYQISDEDHKTKFNGLPTRKKLELLGVPESKADLIKELKQKYTMETIESCCKVDYDKIGLVSWLRYNKNKIACVTNSVSETAWRILSKMNLHSYFDTVISNEDIANPKPHPEGYITAMVRLQCTPKNTIIVEDSPHGIAAARATGALVVPVANATEVNISLLYNIVGP